MQDPKQASNALVHAVRVSKPFMQLAYGAIVRGVGERLRLVRRAKWVQVAAACALAVVPGPPAGTAIGAELPVSELRLIVPFPLTGPRDIQGADRATRSYQAIAPHAPPAVTELMAAQVSAALTSGGTDGDHGAYRMTRERVARLTPARIQSLAAATGTSPHTLVLASSDGIVITPYSADFARRDPTPALTLVAPIAVMPFVLLCARTACAGGAGGLAFARQGGRRAGFHASSGELSMGHLAGELLRRSLDIHSLHVPYNGGNAALSGLASGHVDWMLAALPLALPYTERGKITPLGIAAKERFVLLPELPTLAEGGLGPHVFESWFALFAAPMLPDALVADLRARTRHAIRSGLARTVLLTRGLVPTAESDTEFAVRIAADKKRWGALIDATR